MIKSAEGSAGLLQKITKPAAWRVGAQILEKEEEDARLLDGCEATRKEWMRCLPHKSPPEESPDKRNKSRSGGTLRDGGAESANLYDDVLADSEECYE